VFKSEWPDNTCRYQLADTSGRFSSNVVEKCIRVADPEIRKILVGEVLNRSRLEKLLRDSYGNYVIQTILDYCDMNQRMVVSRRRRL
jgi:hypothetical protein